MGHSIKDLEKIHKDHKDIKEIEKYILEKNVVKDYIDHHYYYKQPYDVNIGPWRNDGDPSILVTINLLNERISQLEASIQDKGQAFIKKEDRPEVGTEVAKGVQKGN